MLEHLGYGSGKSLLGKEKKYLSAYSVATDSTRAVCPAQVDWAPSCGFATAASGSSGSVVAFNSDHSGKMAVFC